MTTINTGSISLSDDEADWLKVMCAVDSNSTRVLVTQAVSSFVRDRRGQYMEKLQYLSQKYGLTVSEVFIRLSKGEELGEPQENFEIDPPTEGSN